MEGKGLIHEHQHGFRKSRSTIDALSYVQGLARHVNSGACSKQEFYLMVTLDVKKASTPLLGRHLNRYQKRDKSVLG